jgi:hypothetical protein
MRFRKSFRMPLVLLVSAWLLPASVCFAQFNYPDFSGAPLLLNGNAAIVDGRLRLTPDIPHQVSSAYHPVKQRLANGFSTTFRFQINGGADGFAFIIQNFAPTALGDDGSGMGYAGIPHSLVIEFDIWYNSAADGIDDPNDNHVAVHTRWRNPNLASSIAMLGYASPPFALADGNVHLATISYNGAGLLSVSLDGVPLLTVNFDHADFLSILDGSGAAWVGFTAATGDITAEHDILSWSFSPTIPGDVNGDGCVDDADLLIVLFNFGTGCP